MNVSQIDITYYILVALSWLGLVWDLRPVPSHILDKTPQPGPEVPALAN